MKNVAYNALVWGSNQQQLLPRVIGGDDYDAVILDTIGVWIS